MSDVSEATQLAAKGHKIELFDGVVTIRFSAWTVKVIEDEYGFDAIDEAFENHNMELLGEFLALGVVDREMTGEQFLKALPLQSLGLATNALALALGEAFPKATPATAPALAKAKAKKTQASRGKTSSISGRSRSTKK